MYYSRHADWRFMSHTDSWMSHVMSGYNTLLRSVNPAVEAPVIYICNIRVHRWMSHVTHKKIDGGVTLHIKTSPCQVKLAVETPDICVCIFWKSHVADEQMDESCRSGCVMSQGDDVSIWPISGPLHKTCVFVSWLTRCINKCVSLTPLPCTAAARAIPMAQ